MGSTVPKQYLPLGHLSILETVLDHLLEFEACGRIIVALEPGDQYFGKLGCAASPRIIPVQGGAERCDSVLAALGRVQTPWVMVHDAARPFVSTADLQALLALCTDGSDGGLLAAPVCDTLKAAGEELQVRHTVPRAGLWRALTPQLFRTAQLQAALEQAGARGVTVTDDASAMELAGYHPRLVEGRGDNFKITTPADLELARVLARARGW